MLRDDVLLLLTEAEGYLSGEEMREKLGVSRAAVSQAVRALRADGYDIDAVTNRGYCLRARPDTLTAGDVLSYLPEARRATVQCFAQIDSTNSYLKAEAMCGAPDGLCAIADRQTAGRGRAGRSFRSDAGQGVYLSMLLRPACAPTAAMTVTAHVAVAVCRALERCGVQPGIKWTNDQGWGKQKLAGILTEIAGIFREQKRYPEAIFWYKTALSCKEHAREGDFECETDRTLAPLLGLTCCLYETGDTDGALAFHRRAEELFPDHPSVRFNSGFFRSMQLL